MDAAAWQMRVTREAALAIGAWLEGRGRLHQPIRCLTLSELEAMATNAISRFVVLGSQRIRDGQASADLIRRLLAPVPAPSAAGNAAASATCTSCGGTCTRITASAPGAASTPAPPSPGDPTA